MDEKTIEQRVSDLEKWAENTVTVDDLAHAMNKVRHDILADSKQIVASGVKGLVKGLFSHIVAGPVAVGRFIKGKLVRKPAEKPAEEPQAV